MELIRKLMDQRATAWESYKSFLDDTEKACKAENRDMSGEEQTKDAKYLADLDSLDKRINDLTALEERNKRFDEQRETYAHITGRDPEADGKKVEQAEADQLRAFLRGDIKSFSVNLSGIGVRANPATGLYEVRDLVKVTTTAGGHTVPTSFRNQLYEHLVENSAIRQTNATVLTTASGENFDIPTTTAAGTAAIVGEGTALAEADPAFGKVTLGAWKYGQLLQVSNELLTDTAVDLVGFIARDAGRALGNASGAHFVTGSGTNQPLGVMIAAGTGVTGGTGQAGAPTADEMIDLFYSVIDPYARNGYWFMARATEGKTRKLKDSNNQYLWQPGMQAGSPNLLLGRPIVSDPNVAATGTNNESVAFGDFSAYYIRDVAGVRFERSDHFAFDKDLVTYRAILRTDGDLVDLTGAIKVYSGGTA